MIRYALVCDADHTFDGWFRSSADFEQQQMRRLVTCPHCGSASVERGLMAPNVVTTRTRDAYAGGDEPAEQPVAASEPIPVAVTPDPRQKAMLEALSDLKRKITASADDVGDRFVEEARKIHYGEAPARGIYGRATADEAKALVEEGIQVHALPVLPDERN